MTEAGDPRVRTEIQDAVDDLLDRTKTQVPLGYTPLKGHRGSPRADPHVTGQRQAAINRENDPPA
jgi:hypothetical protein